MKRNMLPAAAAVFFAAICLMGVYFLTQTNFQPLSNKLGTLKMPATLRVYYLADGNEVETVPVPRRVEADADIVSMAEAAVLHLIEGPSEAEKKEGLSTALPDCKLLGIEYKRPYLYVNFDRTMEQLGGTMRIDGILRQLTDTLTSLAGVKGIIMQIEGKQTGTDDNPFTGDGFLFRALYPDIKNPVVLDFSPADFLDLFIVSIPDRQAMWNLMGPEARKKYGSAARLETSAFAEGLGAWRDYRVVEEKINGSQAQVTIQGTQILEGNLEAGAKYTAVMVKENGIWKWEIGSGRVEG